MAISERQLETWSHQGSKAQSAATYAMIRSVLEDERAPYARRNFEVFLQGSYGNDTNVYADSDVDIAICLTSVFYSETSELSEDGKAAYEANRVAASYSFSDFKREVTEWLSENFGSSVKPGNKAIFVPGRNGRRDADVLACVQHHWYTSYRSSVDSKYREGICFWTANRTKIVNYPKQHMGNCTAKHQATGGWFKPSVRVLKNMRNTMVEDQYLMSGIAPSYFVEGMLWNVPNENFSDSYHRTIESALNWLAQCDPAELSCANDIHWLVRDGVPVCWNMKDFRTFLSSVRKYWNEANR